MPDDPFIGCQLGNFRIDRLIGRGGMAQVYYGYDIKLERPAAIKVLDARYRDNPAYARRFVREAQVVATWRHENILQVYSADEQDGLYYFAMEYVDGPDLRRFIADYVARQQPIPYDEVLRIGRAIANALDYAHQKGVIHRDVKPANVMLTSDGRVALADFGLALDVQQGTLGEVFGSAHYIAPEQARHSAAALPESDLYALGVMLYEMLTGAVPFDDPSPLSVSLQHMTTPPPSPRQRNPALNVAVEAVLLKALSKSPEDRYATGGALIEALAQALTAAPVAPIAAKAAPFARLRRIPEKPVLIGGGVVLAGIVILILLMVGQQKAKERALLTTASLLPTPSPVLTSFSSSTNMVSPLPTATVTFTVVRTDETLQVKRYLPLVCKSLPSAEGARRFVISYNTTGVYILNASGKDSTIAPFAFERLDASGQVQTRFEGGRWARYYSLIRNERCVRAEIRGSTPTRPSECPSFSSQITVLSEDDAIFWTVKAGSTQFRVLWNDQEVGRCDIAAGLCEVFVP